jgi:RHS repeat-associated protein
MYTTIGAIYYMNWDSRNRLIEVNDHLSSGGAATQTVQYTYDAFNRRIAKSVDGDGVGPTATVRTTFTYDGQNVILEFVDPDGLNGPLAAAKTARNLFGPATDQILARENVGGTVAWMLTDHLGTVRDLVSSNGSVVNHLTYDSYGNLIAQTDPAQTSRYRFTGREYDEETGLSFHRARYYDPKVGRFLSEDPISFVGQDTNLFRYASGNPVSLKDPSGLDVDLNLLPASQAPQTVSLKNSSSTVSVVVHGKADGKGFVDAKGNDLPTHELAKLIRANPDYEQGKKIELLSCQSGKGPNPAAQDLADILNSDVVAPTDDITIISTIDHPIAPGVKFKTFEPTYKPSLLQRMVLWFSR